MDKKSGNVTIRLSRREVRFLLQMRSSAARDYSPWVRKYQPPEISLERKLAKAAAAKFVDADATEVEKEQFLLNQILRELYNSEEWDTIKSAAAAHERPLYDQIEEIRRQEKSQKEQLMQSKFDEAGIKHFKASGDVYTRKE